MKETYHSRYGGRKNTKRMRFRFWMLLLVLLIAGGIFYAYLLVLAPNVYVAKDKKASLMIPTGSTFDNVKELLYSQGLIIHRENFELITKLKKYDKSVKPGHYLLSADMNNLELVNKLRSGNQDPVQVTFNNIRFPDQLAGRIANQIEADSLSLVALMRDTAFLDSLDTSPLGIFSLVIPNTYEFYWNTTARDFLKRMKTEADKFWSSREQLMKNLNLNRNQVITLASIVEKETNKNDEKARVAGVYLNRLKKGWLLEADPTLVFAHGNFEIKRVLNIYKEIDSPYNTYKYQGLPPGPICQPSVSSIDAVLNAENHNYMFFCAREDFSGYHSFATTIEEHNVNAWKYQQALNHRKILN